jgi:acyl-CoA synthetase (AMP-forming)/AMP-acid ligase II
MATQLASRHSELELMNTLADIPRRHVHDRPQSIALAFEGRETTYAQLERHSNQVANGLLSAGVRPGERIAYLGKNGDRYFEVLLGAAKVGAVMVPIGWRLTPAEAAAILADCEARMVFVGPEGSAQAESALALRPNPVVVIAMQGAPPPGASAYEAWREAAGVDEAKAVVGPHDIVLQLYTSGTTGRPKGVMLTHENMLAKQRDAARAQLAWHHWTPEDVGLVAMPVAHISGSLWGVIVLLYGAKAIVARGFDPLTVLDFIERDRVSKMLMAPAALQIVLRQPRSREVDYQHLKYIIYGASPIPIDLLRECMDVFGCGFCQQYGLTETTGTIVYLPPEDHDLSGNPKMRAAGRPMPGVQLKILDEDGVEQPTGQVGEVVTRSSSNMAGYWHMPEETAATLDAEGWLRTGDAGYLDEDGYLYIHDRVKDMIISGAENIYPAEVENAIYGHADVADVAVIGVPDEKWGEAVKAVIMLKPGAARQPDDIIAHARARIAAFKVPKSIDFVDELPRNASGKVLRRELRAPYWAGRVRNVN